MPRWCRSALARRVKVEKREDVRFSNGDVQLAGTLISPNTRRRHPAIILVHGSGAEDREYMLPFARFTVFQHGEIAFTRHGNVGWRDPH